MGSPEGITEGWLWKKTTTGAELGRNCNEKQHRVTLTKSFFLGKYPVTQKEYRDVMGNNPSQFKDDNCPVVCVCWNDAKEFCKRLNKIYSGQLPVGYAFDLPTEAQWEYACRAGTTTALNNGRNLTGEYSCSNLNEVAWYGTNSGGRIRPVGQKKANAWGLYDMHGNVWEWCRDCYGKYTGDVTDPVGPSSGSGRVLRGGSWNYYALSCRSAYRFCGRSPYFCIGDLGFRVALVPVD